MADQEIWHCRLNYQYMLCYDSKSLKNEHICLYQAKKLGDQEELIFCKYFSHLLQYATISFVNNLRVYRMLKKELEALLVECKTLLAEGGDKQDTGLSAKIKLLTEFLDRGEIKTLNSDENIEYSVFEAFVKSKEYDPKELFKTLDDGQLDIFTAALCDLSDNDLSLFNNNNIENRRLKRDDTVTSSSSSSSSSSSHSSSDKCVLF
jgi:hypothetical protein